MLKTQKSSKKETLVVNFLCMKFSSIKRAPFMRILNIYVEGDVEYRFNRKKDLRKECEGKLD